MHCFCSHSIQEALDRDTFARNVKTNFFRVQLDGFARHMVFFLKSAAAQHAAAALSPYGFRVGIAETMPAFTLWAAADCARAGKLPALTVPAVFMAWL